MSGIIIEASRQSHNPEMQKCSHFVNYGRPKKPRRDSGPHPVPKNGKSSALSESGVDTTEGSVAWTELGFCQFI